MGEACSTYGERRGVYRVIVGKPEGKTQLGMPRSKWDDNLDLQEMSYGTWTRLICRRIRMDGGHL